MVIYVALDLVEVLT